MNIFQTNVKEALRKERHRHDGNIVAISHRCELAITIMFTFTHEINSPIYHTQERSWVAKCFFDQNAVMLPVVSILGESIVLGLLGEFE